MICSSPSHHCCWATASAPGSPWWGSSRSCQCSPSTRVEESCQPTQDCSSDQHSSNHWYRTLEMLRLRTWPRLASAQFPPTHWGQCLTWCSRRPAPEWGWSRCWSPHLALLQPSDPHHQPQGDQYQWVILVPQEQSRR